MRKPRQQHETIAISSQNYEEINLRSKKKRRKQKAFVLLHDSMNKAEIHRTLIITDYDNLFYHLRWLKALNSKWDSKKSYSLIYPLRCLWFIELNIRLKNVTRLGLDMTRKEAKPRSQIQIWFLWHYTQDIDCYCISEPIIILTLKLLGINLDM